MQILYLDTIWRIGFLFCLPEISFLWYKSNKKLIKELLTLNKLERWKTLFRLAGSTSLYSKLLINFGSDVCFKAAYNQMKREPKEIRLLDTTGANRTERKEFLSAGFQLDSPKGKCSFCGQNLSAEKRLSKGTLFRVKLC